MLTISPRYELLRVNNEPTTFRARRPAMLNGESQLVYEVLQDASNVRYSFRVKQLYAKVVPPKSAFKQLTKLKQLHRKLLKHVRYHDRLMLVGNLL